MPKRLVGLGLSRQDIDALLEQLSAPDPQPAWDELIAICAPVILQVIRIFERDEGQISDAFVHVCERLRANDYQRLRRFDPTGPARFKTWLCIISRNLYLDWRRKKRGRQRPFRFVSQLPTLERAIYQQVFEERRSRSEALRTLEDDFPELTEVQLAEIVDHLQASLTPRQRWFLAARRPQIRSLSAQRHDTVGETDPVDPLPSPEAAYAASEVWTQVQAAMARLEPDARLLLQLRYEQELPLKEVAALLGLANPQAGARRIEAALERLKKIVQATEGEEI